MWRGAWCQLSLCVGTWTCVSNLVTWQRISPEFHRRLFNFLFFHPREYSIYYRVMCIQESPNILIFFSPTEKKSTFSPPGEGGSKLVEIHEIFSFKIKIAPLARVGQGFSDPPSPGGEKRTPPRFSPGGGEKGALGCFYTPARGKKAPAVLVSPSGEGGSKTPRSFNNLKTGRTFLMTVRPEGEI